MRSRYLDPGNPRSARKDFYNPNIIAEFDAYYLRKVKKQALSSENKVSPITDQR